MSFCGYHFLRYRTVTCSILVREMYKNKKRKKLLMKDIVIYDTKLLIKNDDFVNKIICGSSLELLLRGA